MSPLFKVEGLNKKVRVWNSRAKNHVLVDVDYQKLKLGGLTLFHIARMRDTTGHDTRIHRPRTAGDRERVLQLRWAD